MTADDAELPNAPVSSRLGDRAPLRLVHLVYGAVFIASGIAADQTFAASVLLIAWAYVFTHHSRVDGLITAGSLLFLLCLVLSVPTSLIHSRGVAYRSQCKFNLKQLGLALHDYHDVCGSFPPVVARGADGQAMHSWRTLLLPHLDQRPLYDRYDMNEPWDGPNNLTLRDVFLLTFHCPSRTYPDNATDVISYVAVTDERTCWPPDGVRQIRDITDGTSNTILLVECDARDTMWLKPEDLTLDEAIELLTITDPRTARGHHREDRYWTYFNGRHALLADGSVRFFPWNTPAEVWRTALLVDDGTKSDDLDVAVDYAHPNRVPKIANWLKLSWFVFLAIFPLPWVWWNPSSSRRPTSWPPIPPLPQGEGPSESAANQTG